MTEPFPVQRTVPTLRKPVFDDFAQSLVLGFQDMMAAPLIAAFFASFYVGAGLLMAVVTYTTAQTFWLVLAVLGFPLVGTLAAVGFYQTSRCRQQRIPPRLDQIIRFVWSLRKGQMPWLATIIVVVFLFWFFIGHMIFALFLGLSPMTNISTSLDVYLTIQGIQMICVGTVAGAVFATIVFAASVHGIPLLLDRDIDFMTAMLTSMSAVFQHLPRYLAWGLFIGTVTLISMIPLFLGLFISVPVFGHATWHLYHRLSNGSLPR